MFRNRLKGKKEKRGERRQGSEKEGALKKAWRVCSPLFFNWQERVENLARRGRGEVFPFRRNEEGNPCGCVCSGLGSRNRPHNDQGKR